jgi:hypothetical protein
VPKKERGEQIVAAPRTVGPGERVAEVCLKSGVSERKVLLNVGEQLRRGSS